MAKLTKYNPATDGDPMDWLHGYCVTHDWEVWVRERAGGGSFVVGMTRGIVEHAATSSTLSLAVKAVSEEIIDDISDLIA